jgi:hypothetical protein
MRNNCTMLRNKYKYNYIYNIVLFRTVLTFYIINLPASGKKEGSVVILTFVNMLSLPPNYIYTKYGNALQEGNCPKWLHVNFRKLRVIPDPQSPQRPALPHPFS